ncbi:MAG: hypothetical protein K0R57_1146 [Paenibacillaceae bacterium]|nr:hypothetical protein [Paenibacillaceae bacterium]
MDRISGLFMDLFDWIWSASAMAAVTVVLILLMQRILHKRLKPRWQYLLWLLVLARLLLPGGLESDFSIYNWLFPADSLQEAMPLAKEPVFMEAEAGKPLQEVLYSGAVLVWLAGIGAYGTYTWAVNRRFAVKVRRETTPVTDARVLQLFAQCRERMSVRTEISLVESAQWKSPGLYGYAKPRLVMPKAVIGSLNEEQLCHVFLHELAHCKRHDIAINWLMQLLLIIHWFNPVLWYGYHRMRDDQELASDAMALSYLPPEHRKAYGYTLIQLLENSVYSAPLPGNVNMSGNRSQLQRRIIMIKHFKARSYRWSAVGLGAIVILAGCTLTDAKLGEESPSASPSPTPPAIEQKAAGTENASPSPSPSDIQQEPGASGGQASAPSGSQTPAPSGNRAPSAPDQPGAAAPAAPSAPAVLTPSSKEQPSMQVKEQAPKEPVPAPVAPSTLVPEQASAAEVKQPAPVPPQPQPVSEQTPVLREAPQPAAPAQK